MAILVANQHLCLSAIAWNSVLFQTQPGAAMGSRDRWDFSPGRFVYMACTNISVCRNTGSLR
jgi:hypothetical protein